MGKRLRCAVALVLLPVSFARAAEVASSILIGDESLVGDLIGAIKHPTATNCAKLMDAFGKHRRLSLALQTIDAVPVSATTETLSDVPCVRCGDGEYQGGCSA